MKYSKFSKPKESPGLLFWQVATSWQRKIKEALRPYKITHTQFVILAVTHELNTFEENVSQQMISDFSKIDVMTISSSLRLLEKNGFVERKQHPTDTRSNCIKNTDNGESVLKAVNPIIEQIDDAFFFSDKNDLSSFMELLEKLKDD